MGGKWSTHDRTEEAHKGAEEKSAYSVVLERKAGRSHYCMSVPASGHRAVLALFQVYQAME